MVSIVSQAAARIAPKLAARSATRLMSSSAKPPPQKFVEQTMPGSKMRMEKNNFVTDGTKGWWRNDLGEKVEGNIWMTAANGKPTPDTTCLAAACRKVTVFHPKTDAPMHQALQCNFF